MGDAIRLGIPESDTVSDLRTPEGSPVPVRLAARAQRTPTIQIVLSRPFVLGFAVVLGGQLKTFFADPGNLLTVAGGLLYLIYMQFEAYLLTPRIMNKAIAVPGSLVIIAALVGGTLLGLLGALVSIPVTAAILLIIKQVHVPRQDAKL